MTIVEYETEIARLRLVLAKIADARLYLGPSEINIIVTGCSVLAQETLLENLPSQSTNAR